MREGHRIAAEPPPPARKARGQALVEFVIVLPIMLVLAMGILDLSRIYTTMLNVESAAREAADYGTTLGAGKWEPTIATAQTVPEMVRRACVAAKNLPDYAGSSADCTNPSFSYCVTPYNDTGSPSGGCGALNPADACDNPTRPYPCTVTVTLTYVFHLITPLHLEVMGTDVGFPSTMTFSRDSTFAITDIDLSPSAAP